MPGAQKKACRDWQAFCFILFFNNGCHNSRDPHADMCHHQLLKV